MKNIGALQLRLSRIMDLSQSEVEVLCELEANGESRAKKTDVFTKDIPNDRIAILRSGWAAARAQTHGGLTTILNIYTAGDIVGLSNLGAQTRSTKATMLSDGSVNLLDRETFMTMGLQEPRLLMAFFALDGQNTESLNNRMHTISRYSAEDRLAHFILTLKANMDDVSALPSDKLLMPFSQRQIGDALGLTSIYVNRLMRNLVRAGHISISRPYITINDRKSWQDQIGFQNPYTKLDLSWLNSLTTA
jgi:CRP/FNR family transcriptional regulator